MTSSAASAEQPMLTLDAIQVMADRIERAYLRRRPRWNPGCSNPRVWSAAASALLQVHQSDPSIPVDPELFVASQPVGLFEDPWQDLTQQASADRYRRRVRQIVRQLRRELQYEIRLAEVRLQLGKSVEDVLRIRGRWFSPLGRFILAHRAGRPDLAESWRSQAQDQHRSCPLYRSASRRLLPRAAYPVAEAGSGLRPRTRFGPAIPPFSAN